jgi:hypothetical protein
MKKLKLSALQLGSTELLTREQMKNVMAGGTCAYYLPGGSASGGPIATYNVSASDAQWWANQGGSGAHWCCDSCGSASWYGI